MQKVRSLKDKILLFIFKNFLIGYAESKRLGQIVKVSEGSGSTYLIANKLYPIGMHLNVYRVDKPIEDLGYLEDVQARGKVVDFFSSTYSIIRITEVKKKHPRLLGSFVK